MIKEALQYVVGLNKPEILTVNGSAFTDKKLDRISEELTASSITFTTLQGLVSYLKLNVDRLQYDKIVHVVSPTEVRLISNLNKDRERECPVVVKAEIPEFSFGRWMDSEEFVIGMQAKFIPDEKDYASVLAFSGTAESGTVAQYSDDGISQKATVKTGITQKADAIVPNPVTLRPFRTFTEVEQPQSQFIFRMDNKRGDGIQCALFEADGKAWRKAAMDNIKKYLDEELAAVEKVSVIA